MDTIPGLAATHARKRALVMESELNRQVLRIEWGRIYLHSERLRHNWTHGAWKWAVPIAGFLLARRFKRTSGFFGKGSVVMTALGALWKVWQSVRSRPSHPVSPTARP